VGNAVPPPLARALGIEIRKSIAARPSRPPSKVLLPKPMKIISKIKKEKLEENL